MPLTSKQMQGNEGEKHAVNYLKQKGYKILDTKFKARYLEVDIIASKGQTTVFFEVKTRSSDEFGSAEESIDKRKILNLEKAAKYYSIINKDIPSNFRIDALCIYVDTPGKKYNIVHYENISQL